MPARLCRRLFDACLAACLVLASNAALAFDFKTVGPRPVVLYDAPSLKGNKLYVAPSGMPVEILLSYGDWVKVRDASGDMAWLEARGLSAKRNVIVRAASTKLRAAPDDNAPVVLVADKSVLLELVDPDTDTWLRVRHRDGATGYVKAADVWGVATP